MRVFIYLILLFVFCISCTKTDRWRNSTIQTGLKEFDSSKLVYPASNYLHDYQLEFTHVNQTLRGYVNFYTQTAPSLEKDQQVTQIKICADGNEYIAHADRLAGGQRIRFQTQTLSLLVQLLKKHKVVTLTFQQGMKFVVQSEDFKKHFKALKAKPLLYIPNDPIGIAL